MSEQRADLTIQRALRHLLDEWDRGPMLISGETLAAIEAEARAAVLAEVRREVAYLSVTDERETADSPDDTVWNGALAAVLAILDRLAALRVTGEEER